MQTFNDKNAPYCVIKCLLSNLRKFSVRTRKKIPKKQKNKIEPIFLGSGLH